MSCTGVFGRRRRLSWAVVSVLLIVFPLFGQAQTCVPSPDGVVGWWSAEGDGDDQTHVNPGILQGGVTFQAGKVGQAFAFHGGVDAVKIAASASLDVGVGNGLTIELWVNPQNLLIRNPLVEWNREGTTSSEWGTHFWLLKPGDFERFP